MAAVIGTKNISKLTIESPDLLGIENLSPSDITSILDLAAHYVTQNRRKSYNNNFLKGMVMVNMLLENSTRTRISFDMAAKRLGAEVINMYAEGSSIQKGESLADTLRSINAMRPDIAVIRHQEAGAAQKAADILDCPVINAGDGTGEHPTQALLDALTLRDHFGTLEGLRIAICGDILHSRVAHSNAFLLQKMGASLSFVGPKELMPEGLSRTTSDMEEGLRDADAVMVLRIQKERLQKNLSFTEQAYFEAYGITPRTLAFAKKDAVILHPGPMNRGVEIDPVIADDPARSLITRQVEMGVAVRMACLDLVTRPFRQV